MTFSLWITVSSGILLLAFFLLFKTEASNGRRLVLSNSRNFLDSKLSKQNERWSVWRRYFGASSFRLFLHYSLHQLLGAFLYIVRKLEALLNRLRHHNRNIAKDVKGPGSDNHLSHIAAHKASTALSEEEKETLKERSLND